MRNKTQKGFTLIELLVVIAIIGLLASVVLLALGSARVKARDARRVADVRQLASALELYFNDNSTYPVQGTAALTITGLTPNYIGVLPIAPLPVEAGCTATQNDYMYTGTVNSYTINFCLAADTGGVVAGPHIITNNGIQ